MNKHIVTLFEDEEIKTRQFEIRKKKDSETVIRKIEKNMKLNYDNLLLYEKRDEVYLLKHSEEKHF